MNINPGGHISHQDPPHSSYEHLSSSYRCSQPINRHSLNVVPSDDSGNESSINYQAKIPSHFVVVAIDFGTTFSGYAFAFTRDMDSILMMRKVDGNDPGSFYISFVSKICFFFLVLSLQRCHQSKNSHDHSSHTEFRISFLRLFRTRFLS